MHNPSVLTVALLLSTSGALPVLAQTGGEVPDRLMAQFAEAWSRDDSAAVALMFAEDALFLETDTLYAGRDAIDAFQSPIMAGSEGMEITPLRSGTSGDLAFQVGRWTLAHEGGPSTGVHTFVFRRDPDGEWRVVSAHVEGDDAETP